MSIGSWTKEAEHRPAPVQGPPPRAVTIDKPPSAAMSKWAGAAGIAFAVLFFVGFGAGNTPKYDASNQAWVSWFHDSGHRASQIIGAFSTVAASLLLTVFFVVLLRRAVAAGGSRTAALIAGVAGTVMTGVFAVSAVIRTAISGGVTFAPSHFPVPSADVARTLDNLSVALVLVAGGLAGAVFVAALARTLRNTFVVPGWLVNAGYVVAVLLVGSFEFFPFMLLLLWVLVVGVAMLAGRPTRKSRAATAEPGTMP
jgi:hypothetical protein